ncbi:hypothetical protein A3K63_04200 [Candidatus Micrarchaeota archaeon RBG_16_49_10]|nr:MAG: hypothetical protein A3K63_04200 [Candidatus Micrarchaeota archaeon RBG_16_49_10]
MRTKSGTTYEAGDIVLVPFPFTDLSGMKKRPALVVSNNMYNRSSEDFIICSITSNLQNREHSVLISSSDLESGFIPKTSIVKVNNIHNFKQGLALKKIGRVKKKVLKEVKEKLFELMG